MCFRLIRVTPDDLLSGLASHVTSMFGQKKTEERILSHISDHISDHLMCENKTSDIRQPANDC